MKAIGKYIVIKELTEQDVKTESGLLLSGADSKSFRYQKAEVVKPGTEVSVIKEGDLVYYDKGHGFTMLIEGEPFTIIMERDVVVVL